MHCLQNVPERFIRSDKSGITLVEMLFCLLLLSPLILIAVQVQGLTMKMIPESRDTLEQISGFDDTLYELYHAIKYSKELSITNNTILETDGTEYEFIGNRLLCNGEDYAQGVSGRFFQGGNSVTVVLSFGDRGSVPITIYREMIEGD